jgi:hypothetical protein
MKKKKKSSSLSSSRDVYWALDSEFMMSGRKGNANDVHSIQFSNGVDSTFIENRWQLRRFFQRHPWITKMYAFSLDVEVGSLRAMLGESYETHAQANKLGAIKFYRLGNRKICEIKFHELGFHCFIYDIQQLCHNLGFRSLKQLGKYLGFPKDERPDWLGVRKWQTPEEKEIFVKYAVRDAEITSRAARMLNETWKIDPEKYASAGTIAKKEFCFPERLRISKEEEGEEEKKRLLNIQLPFDGVRVGVVKIPYLEDRVRRIATFGGRSECFRIGFMKDVYYNDVKSLYPASMLATRCLQITGATECELSELDVTGVKAPDKYGWIDGYFSTDNDLWGLPKRDKNNLYMTGKFGGLYHTFDLAAAKAKVIYAHHCYRPVWNPNAKYHEKLAEMFFNRLSGKLSKEDSIYAKAIMNSSSGKLGQGTSWGMRGMRKGKNGNPSYPATTSNFFAYNTLLAHSHFTMSRLYDLFTAIGAPILYTDTDSIMTTRDLSGTHFHYSDGVRDIPITLDIKAHGDLSLFRSKRYILDTSVDADGYSRDGFAAHGWRYGRESFLALRNGNVKSLDTRIQIKSTPHTRNKEALKMELGRWRNKQVTLTLEDITRLLSADTKRNRGKNREDYDSYQLVSEGKSINSKSWTSESIYEMPEAMDPESYDSDGSQYFDDL